MREVIIAGGNLVIGIIFGLNLCSLVHASEKWVTYNMGNWDKICAAAPYTGEIPPEVVAMLSEEHWQAVGGKPTPPAINNTCLALGKMPKAPVAAVKSVPPTNTEIVPLPLPEAQPERKGKRR